MVHVGITKIKNDFELAKYNEMKKNIDILFPLLR